jgi:hypothetical protein
MHSIPRTLANVISSFVVMPFFAALSVVRMLENQVPQYIAPIVEQETPVVARNFHTAALVSQCMNDVSSDHIMMSQYHQML